jgi:hypothetical protein
VFQISFIEIRNLDSIGSPVSLLQSAPDRSHTMNDSISLRTNARLVMVTADMYAHLLDGQGNTIENNVSVDLGVTDLTLVNMLGIKVSESLLLATKVTDSMNYVERWLATIVVPASVRKSCQSYSIR